MSDITRRVKYVVFNNKEEAERFQQLYGGYIEHNFYFHLKYFGEKVKDKYVVAHHFGTAEFEEVIKNLELKKKKWNGKLIYVF